MKIPRETIILIFVTILICCGNLYAQDAWIKLYGEIDNKHTKLYWEAYDWPEDIKGFYLKRRIIKKDNPAKNWIQLNSEPIIPAVSKHRNWSNLGLSEIQSENISKTFSDFIEKGLLIEMDENQMLEILKEKGGLGTGDRIRMKNDYNLALVLGFAFIDNSIDEELVYEYGLFPVSNNGNVAKTAVYICKVGIAEPLDFEINFERLANGIEINWKIPKSKYELHGVFGFQLLKSISDTAMLKAITSTPLGTYKEDKKYYYGHFIDSKEDHNQNHLYAISVLNTFQNEISRMIKLFKAEEFMPVSSPKINEIKLEEDLYPKLQWEINKKESARIKGFLIEISQKLDDKTFRIISDTLNPDMRIYLDTIMRSYGEIYFYRIKAFDHYTNFSYSKIKEMYYMGLVLPPPVVGANSSVYRKDGSTFIKISWEPKMDTDSITNGYIIFSDEIIPDTFYQLASVPLIKDTFYIHKIINQGGREYKFRIVPMSKHSVQGPFVEVNDYVEITSLPAFEKFEVTLASGYNAVINWVYPEIKELEGFRLFMNDEQIAGTDELRDTIRKFFVKGIKPGKGNLCEFVIEAIGVNNMSRKSLRQSLLLSNYNPSDMLPPDSLTAEFKIKDSLEYAYLQWAEADLDSLGIQGYILYVDYAYEGSVVRLSSLHLIAENYYWYELPGDKKRKKYTFRIAPMSVTRKIGPYSETEISIPEEIPEETKVIQEGENIIEN